MKVQDKDRNPPSSRRRGVVIGLGLAAAILIFFLGRFTVYRPEPAPAAPAAKPAGRKAEPGRSAELAVTADSAPRLERAAEKLAESLSPFLLPAGEMEQESEQVRDGSGSWTRLRCRGRYRDLKLFFSNELSRLRDTLAHDCGFDCLAATDPVSGTFTILLLSGHRVVLIGEFSSLLPPPEPVALERGPMIAIIIDDMGRSLAAARRLADLDLPLTFAVFPHLPNSRRVAELLSRRRRDIILHLPMEPRNWPRLDPGPGALYCRMSEAEFRRVLDADLKAVPGIIGVNNHMGSRLTEDRAKMRLVMQSLAGTGLFFIDSRTISDTVAWKEAEAVGIPVLQRDVFLDNRPDEKSVLEQFRVLVAVACSRGYAVGIGHPYPATIAALARISPQAEAAGVELVPVRELVAARDGRRAVSGFPAKHADGR